MMVMGMYNSAPESFSRAVFYNLAAIGTLEPNG